MVTDEELTVQTVVCWTKLDFKLKKKRILTSVSTWRRSSSWPWLNAVFALFSCCCQFLTMNVIVEAKSFRALKKIKWFQSLFLSSSDRSGLSCTNLAASTVSFLYSGTCNFRCTRLRQPCSFFYFPHFQKWSQRSENLAGRQVRNVLQEVV